MKRAVSFGVWQWLDFETEKFDTQNTLTGTNKHQDGAETKDAGLSPMPTSPTVLTRQASAA